MIKIVTGLEVESVQGHIEEYKVGERGVTKIEEHRAAGEGNKWYYDVHIDNGEITREFRPVRVFFRTTLTEAEIALLGSPDSGATRLYLVELGTGNPTANKDDASSRWLQVRAISADDAKFQVKRNYGVGEDEYVGRVFSLVEALPQPDDHHPTPRFPGT